MACRRQDAGLRVGEWVSGARGPGFDCADRNVAILATPAPVGLGADRVADVGSLGEVAAQPHRRGAGDASELDLPDRGPPHVVEHDVDAGQLRRHTRARAEVPDPFPVTMEHHRHIAH